MMKMDGGESLYLIMVVAGFATFIAVLALVSQDWTRHCKK